MFVGMENGCEGRDVGGDILDCEQGALHTWFCLVEEGREGGGGAVVLLKGCAVMKE